MRPGTDSLLSEIHAWSSVSRPTERGNNASMRVLLAATMVASATLSTVVSAEVVPLNTLGRVGATDLQIRTGNAVQAVCGQFIAANNDGTPPADALEAELFDKCGEMVHTARTVTGEDGATHKSLLLSREELQGALQNIAGEEAGASGSAATEMSAGQSANIAKRISTLLSRSSGLQLSAVNVFGNDALYALSEEDLGFGGGGAGDDDLLGSRLGIFVNGDIGSGEKDATDGEDGFSYDSTGLTIGVDYRLSNQTVFGVAAGYNSSESEFDKTATVSGGSLDSNATTLSAYGLYYADNYYMDGILSFGQGSFDLERKITIQSNSEEVDNGGSPNDGVDDRTAESDTDSSQLLFSVGGGTDIVKGAMTYAPYARVQYLKVDIDGFEETGAGGLNLRVEDQEIESVTSAFGVRMSMVKNTGSGAIIPQARLEWIHEYSDDEREVTTVYIHDPRQNELLFVTDSPDRDYFTLGLGLSAVFRGGTQAFADVRTLIGMSDFSETVVTLGARFAL